MRPSQYRLVLLLGPGEQTKTLEFTSEKGRRYQRGDRLPLPDFTKQPVVRGETGPSVLCEIVRLDSVEAPYAATLVCQPTPELASIRFESTPRGAA